jgi:site-specific recombinase XerD
MNAITTLQQPHENPAVAYLAGLSEGGRRTQRQALGVIAELLGCPDIFVCGWAALRYAHTQAIRAKLTEAYKPATANKILSALRGVLKQAWKLSLMSAEDYHLAVSVENVKGETLPAGRELSSGEISALMAGCENDPTPAGVRDAAIIGVMYAAGLRRDEVVSLNLEDFRADTGELVVKGKRNKERKAHILNGAGRAVRDWLAVRGSVPGPLFLPVNKSNKITHRRMTTQAVYKMLRKRAKAAGVADFSPHDMRRTFVSDLLDAGADIATVAKMAGHASVNTTARYDRRPEEAKRKAAGLLHVPYKGRK